MSSSNASIFLFGLALSEDVKQFGCTKVLEVFKEELADLQTDGIQLDDGTTMRFALGVVTGDNLGRDRTILIQSESEIKNKEKFPGNAFRNFQQILCWISGNFTEISRKIYSLLPYTRTCLLPVSKSNL
jgi:hypothetical protein